MKIKIADTKDIIDLRYYVDDVDMAQDIIGNSGETNIRWDKDEEVYISDADTIDWWKTYFTDLDKTRDEVKQLAAETGLSEEYILDRIAQNIGNDYGDERSESVQAMNDIRAEVSSNFVTTAEAAEILGVTTSGIQRMILTGKLHAQRVGGRVLLIRRSDLAGVKRSNAGRPRKTAPK